MKNTSLNLALKALFENRAATFSAVVLILISGLAFLAPLISPYTYEAQNLLNTYAVPSAKHWFGTDALGRDVLSRVIYGGRVSMLVALLSTLVIVIIGTLWGAVSGYFGGWVDRLMMRVVDILYALPYMFFVIILMMVLGRDIFTLFIAIGVLSWLTMARIVRGQILSLKNQDFISAARVLGSSHTKIITKHLIPNTLGTIAVYATITIPRMILLEAFLSFLGLGIQEPIPSWGSLCNNGAEALSIAPWLIVFPGIAMAVTLTCFNLFGDGLRDAVDPHIRGET